MNDRDTAQSERWFKAFTIMLFVLLAGWACWLIFLMCAAIHYAAKLWETFSG